MDLTSPTLFVLLIAFSVSTKGDELEINSYEYSRRVPSIKSIDIGHCVNRMEELFPGHHIQKKCSLPPRRGPMVHAMTNTNATRFFQARGIKDIFDSIGLCDGRTSSVLGLLNDGKDCLAIDIAGMLTFGSKTYIQTYIEHYQSAKSELVRKDGIVPMALQDRFDKNFFLQSRLFGTMEVLILEMRYSSSKKKIEALKANHGRFQHISSFFNNAIREVGKPSSLKLIRLSTAKEQYELHRYKHYKIDDAIYKIAAYESDINHIRYDIQKQHIKPHLKYGLRPYTSTGQNKITDNRAWEKASELEVKIVTALKRNKRLSRKCKKALVGQCSNLPNIKRDLMKIQTDIHSIRSKWYFNDSSITKKTVGMKRRKAKQLHRELMTISRKIREAMKSIKKKSKRKGVKRTRKPRH